MTSRFKDMPASLRNAAKWERIGRSEVPVMLVHPDWNSGAQAPVMIWLHGRTASKEIDPGRFLRWMRAGIGACAVDLPGHGERFDSKLQESAAVLDVVAQMVSELDDLVSALGANSNFDISRIGLGGMSAGGMAALVRLCSPHAFTCASVEATSGNWRPQRDRVRFQERSEEELEAMDPIRHLDTWREIGFQAIHARGDQWMDFNTQEAFVHALRERYTNSENVEWIVYDHTGAPYEHIGFGRMATDAKNRQAEFLQRWLLSGLKQGPVAQ
ncbi:MAG TPA: alpha/beta fold hydrolase [Phycisphaerales bacterium]|nr:alpha/beta fold hydrolase [Phycisphaerales bacterium]